MWQHYHSPNSSSVVPDLTREANDYFTRLLNRDLFKAKSMGRCKPKPTLGTEPAPQRWTITHDWSRESIWSWLLSDFLFRPASSDFNYCRWVARMISPLELEPDFPETPALTTDPEDLAILKALDEQFRPILRIWTDAKALCQRLADGSRQGTKLEAQRQEVEAAAEQAAEALETKAAALLSTAVRIGGWDATFVEDRIESCRALFHYNVLEVAPHHFFKKHRSELGFEADDGRRQHRVAVGAARVRRTSKAQSHREWLAVLFAPSPEALLRSLEALWQSFPADEYRIVGGLSSLGLAKHWNVVGKCIGLKRDAVYTRYNSVNADLDAHLHELPKDRRAEARLAWFQHAARWLCGPCQAADPAVSRQLSKMRLLWDGAFLASESQRVATAFWDDLDDDQCQDCLEMMVGAENRLEAGTRAQINAQRDHFILKSLVAAHTLASIKEEPEQHAGKSRDVLRATIAEIFCENIMQQSPDLMNRVGSGFFETLRERLMRRKNIT